MRASGAKIRLMAYGHTLKFADGSVYRVKSKAEDIQKMHPDMSAFSKADKSSLVRQLSIQTVMDAPGTIVRLMTFGHTLESEDGRVYTVKLKAEDTQKMHPDMSAFSKRDLEHELALRQESIFIPHYQQIDLHIRKCVDGTTLRVGEYTVAGSDLYTLQRMVNELCQELP